MFEYDLQTEGTGTAEAAEGYAVNEDLNRGDVTKVMRFGLLFGAAYGMTSLMDTTDEMSEQKVAEEGFDYSHIKEGGSWEAMETTIDVHGLEPFTETTGYLATTDEMVQVAEQLEEDSVMETIVADSEYVKEHFGTRGYYLGLYDVNVPETAAEAFEDGTGVCVEHATLFTALAREQDIPALVRVGIFKGGGHAWAEVPVETAEGIEYLVVDPTNNYIGPDTDDYIHSFESGSRFEQLSDALAVTDNVKDFDSYGKLLLYDMEKLPDITEALRDPAANMEAIKNALEQAKIEIAPEDLENVELLAEYGQYINSAKRFGLISLASYGLTSLSNRRKMSVGGAAKALLLGMAGGMLGQSSSFIFGLGQYSGLCGAIGAYYGGTNTEKNSAEVQAEKLQGPVIPAANMELLQEEE